MSLVDQYSRAYELIVVELPYCFNCGRDASQRPETWYADWFLHRAHIAAGGSKMVRVIDRRATNVLCPLCHMLHFTKGCGTMRVNGVVYPLISNANALWLKRERDQEWFDQVWLAQHWIGELPEPVPPPEVYLSQFELRGRM